jgi:8-oxo-dGTP diphosphatase
LSRGQILVVAAALYDERGHVLIAERPRDKHMGGRWEFPGGKVEQGEPERVALGRELREELGIEVEAAEPLMRLRHAYPDRDVELSLWVIGRYRGTPQPCEQQRLKWVAPELLSAEDILEADRPFVQSLSSRPAP